jgi:hypothetical protein
MLRNLFEAVGEAISDTVDNVAVLRWHRRESGQVPVFHAPAPPAAQLLQTGPGCSRRVVGLAFLRAGLIRPRLLVRCGLGRSPAIRISGQRVGIGCRGERFDPVPQSSGVLGVLRAQRRQVFLLRFRFFLGLTQVRLESDQIGQAGHYLPRPDGSRSN